MSKKPTLEKIVAQGRKYVLGLLDDGWQLDDFYQDSHSANWSLYHIRSGKRAIVMVDLDFCTALVYPDGRNLCGCFIVNGVIKAFIEF